MLKVCGISYDHVSNYGSCLQCYALQKAIENTIINGEHCEYALIPYSNIKTVNNLTLLGSYCYVLEY